MIEKILNKLIAGYKVVAKLTNPLRELPYGEDGKYIHIFVMGVPLGLLWLLQKDSNLLGMMLGGFVVGYLFEKIQSWFFGSNNTEKEQLVDSAYVMAGTTLVGLIGICLDLVRWVY